MKRYASVPVNNAANDTSFKAGGPSPNPGGRPKGLARLAREKVGNDGDAIITFWLEIMNDATRGVRERLDASKLLAERGWGKPAAFQLIEDDDPLGREQEDLDSAVELFNAEVVRLTIVGGAGTATSNGGAAVEPNG